ncbi:hypothetical protein HY489_05240 [Candidatus Woesearchaeota archaeon]|nr:hypothetical protein [Candidatus Woesearchaeota archaeon]
MAMPKEVIPPTSTQRCPKCHKMTCSFNVDTNSIECTACGFEAKIKV